MIMKEKLKKFLDIIFPPGIICIYCGNEIRRPNLYHACDECLQNLPYLNGKTCSICGAKLHSLSDICFVCHSTFPPFEKARATFVYEAPIVSLVHKMKFGNAKYLFEPLGNFMTKTYKENGFACDVIVPVPLSKERLQERGYNQAAELAKVVGKNLNLPVVENVIEKVKHTPKQSSLSFHERMKNVKNAYRLRQKAPLTGKNVLVVDDVMTTSETMRSICKELWRARPQNIFVLTLAHTDIHNKPKSTMVYKIKKLALSKLNREIAFAKNRFKIRKKIKEYEKVKKDEEKKG